MKSLILILSLIVSISSICSIGAFAVPTVPTPTAPTKPFKRVLVMSGGGINPGVPLGIIAGLKESGWHPDLIIVTCGFGIGAIAYNSQPSITDSYDLATSENFYRALSEVVIQTTNGLDLIKKINKAKNIYRYPDIFDRNLLYAPQELARVFNPLEFNRDSRHPRMIVVSSRALFSPHQVGQLRQPGPLFQQAYFTDPDTAVYLQDRKLSAARTYPQTTLMSETVTISNEDTATALRAGIADPYLLNPNVVGGYYHFTGAVDLFPFDLATELGEEVVATYPQSLFLDYEDTAIRSAFGFKQTTRALEAIQHKDIKWIDINGSDEISFNPDRLLVVMRSGIPEDYTQYKLGVGRQWTFGRDRAREAIKVAPGTKTDVRWHLRKPINPKLLEDFSCKNAYEWKTDQQESCVSDKSSKCDRTKAKTCVPIR